jgi:hypothetical protein
MEKKLTDKINIGGVATTVALSIEKYISALEEMVENQEILLDNDAYAQYEQALNSRKDDFKHKTCFY